MPPSASRKRSSRDGAMAGTGSLIREVALHARMTCKPTTGPAPVVGFAVGGGVQ